MRVSSRDNNFDFLISGYGSSNSGTGRFLSYIETIKRKGTKKIYRFNYIKEIRFYRKSRNLLKLVFYLSISLFLLMRYYIIVYTLRDKHLLIFHPHSLGLREFNYLLRRNRITIFVLDNSFFCMQAYNYRGENKECFDCVSSFQNYSADCKPYPFDYSKKENISTLSLLKRRSKDIQFLAQNQGQKNLLLQVYGPDIKVEVLGMLTGEVNPNNIPTLNDRTEKHDLIVYHGGLSQAKGLSYFVELARYLPDYQFLIPERNDKVINMLNNPRLTSNLIFEQCTWEDGLKEYVESSTLTICPSLWSAPIEGALIKSLAHSRRVACVKTEHGFTNEIPSNCVLFLPANPRIAAEIVSQSLQDRRQQRRAAIDWLRSSLVNMENKLQDFFS